MIKQEKELIGSLIQKVLDNKGFTPQWLAERIDCKRRNIYDIFKRSSLDTVKLLKISVALKTDLFKYFSEIYENTIDETMDATPKIRYIFPIDFHVGNLIKNKLEEDGLSVIWLSKMIHCKRNNIYDILNNRASIDTERLLRICIALKVNFFVYYSDLYENTVSQY